MIPIGLVAMSYGGGVDSVAMILRLHQLGIVPKSIVMADPGDEQPGTIRYLAEHTQPLLRNLGWPAVVVVSRRDEGVLRPPLPEYRGERRLETLREECTRIHALPSIAYGWKKCSQKYKGEPQRWWMARQQWAQDEWAAGRVITRAIGYDYDERSRVENGLFSPTKWEADRFVPWYPLYEARLTRDACEALILSAGLPAPPKSSCTFCPSNTLDEWKWLRANEPGKFAEAVEMSRNAEVEITSPDVVGLMRCNQPGRRQLHEWADGKYDSLGPLFEREESIPCECAT